MNHHPTYSKSKALKTARSRAGRKSVRARRGLTGLDSDEIPSEIRSIGQCVETLEVIVKAVLQGRLDPRTGNTATLAINGISKLLDYDLEERLKEIEARVEQITTTRHQGAVGQAGSPAQAG